MKSDRINNKKIKVSVVVIYTILVIASLIFMISIPLQTMVIHFGEKLIGRELVHQAWYNRFSGIWTINFIAILTGCFVIIIAPYISIKRFILCGKIRDFLIKNKTVIKEFLFYFVIIGLSFCLFFHYHITSDFTYVACIHEVKPPQFDLSFAEMLAVGRYFVFVISYVSYLFDLVGVNLYGNNTWVLIAVGIAFMSCAATVLSMLIRKMNLGCNLNIVRLCVLLCFINPLIIEAYIYGAYDWGIGILFAVLTAYFVGNEKKGLIILFSFLAISAYQTNIFIALVLVCSITLLKYGEEKISVIIKKEALFLSLVMLGGIGNVFLTKIGIWLSPHNNVFEGKNPTLLANKGPGQFIKSYFLFIADVYKSVCGYLPRYFLIIIISIILFLFVLNLRLQRMDFEKVFVILACIICILVFPCCFKIVTDYAPVARIIIPLFFAVGMFVLICCAFCKIKSIQYIIYSLVILFSLIVFFYTESYIADTYIGQGLDNNLAIEINSKIEKYEEQNSIEVTKILTSGTGRRYSWPQQFNNKYYSYNHPIMLDEWSQSNYINFINGTDYTGGLMSEKEINTYFENRNDYNSVDLDEQLVFVDDTLYWYVY